MGGQSSSRVNCGIGCCNCLASEQRPTPVLIGELAFHGLSDAGKDLNRLVTVLSVKERTVAGVLEALRSGHAYAVGDGDHHVQLRLDEFRVMCQGGTRSASVGDRLDPVGARDLMVRLSVTASDRGRHPVKVRVIRSGQVVAQLAGETPFRRRLARHNCAAGGANDLSSGDHRHRRAVE